MYSKLIFFFPFKWNVKRRKEWDFTQQIDLANLRPSAYSNWQRNLHPDEEDAKVLYDEKCYYYPFVRDVLYDTGKPDTLVYHFERRETKPDANCFYHIKVNKGKEFVLKLEAINLNFYSTGVGMLTFYLRNDSYKELEEILAINQYGRRIFPPFFEDIQKRSEIAERLWIEGLDGDPDRYAEDFSEYTVRDAWKPARFIRSLIGDFQSSLEIQSAIDDRMFVSCWYANDALAKRFTSSPSDLDECIAQQEYGEFNGTNEEYKGLMAERFSQSKDWYRFLYVDANEPTCQHEPMRRKIVAHDTYFRWAGSGSLYGVTRYSFMLLTGTGDYPERILSKHIQTVYARMVEFVLIQKMSILKFSEAVTDVSNLKGKQDVVANRIGSLYKEYIRFMNQYYFKEVTAQDQGIELYQLLEEQMEIEACAKDLDEEISELHGYISLMIDEARNKKAELLNIIAALVLPPTVIAGLFGMNAMNDMPDFAWQLLLIIAITLGCLFIIRKKLWKF